MSCAAALDSNPRPNRRRSGERDARHIRIVDQRLADLRPAGHDIDDAGRKMRQRPLDQAQRRQRRQLRRLDDDGVPRRQRRRDLPDQQQQRIVERDDRRDHAERLLDGEIDLMFAGRRNRHPVGVARDLGVVLKAGGRPLDLVEVLDARLAAFERKQLRETRAIFTHQGRRVVQQLPALDRRHVAPLAPCLSGLRAGPLGVVGAALDDLVDDLERRRILDPSNFFISLGAWDPLTINPECFHAELFIMNGAVGDDRLLSAKFGHAEQPETSRGLACAHSARKASTRSPA